MTLAMVSQLRINAFELELHLGWTKAEKSLKQRVFLDICIDYVTPPLGCVTDNLDDTLCYAKLTRLIESSLATQRYSLVEYLAKAIYDLIKPMLPVDAVLSICLTKHPRIEKLPQGICFTYGDRK